MTFHDFDLVPSVLQGITDLGFDSPTPIQEAAIPAILDGKDILACAQTGTGKTGAYLIPILHQMEKEPADHTRVLVLVPTRELAKQIDQNVDGMSYHTGVTSVSIIGGNNPKDWDAQTKGIRRGADILIATPGRLGIHKSLGYLKLDQIETVVLDEADRMLDMGFQQDIMAIMDAMPNRKQTLMFSATMPKKIREFSLKILNEPVQIDLNLSQPAEGVTQVAYHVFENQKIPLVRHLLEEKEVESMIIFAGSKSKVDAVHRTLKSLNYDVAAIHSDKDQAEREETLRHFKNRKFRILVGTDVLARGIDIDNLSHVLNFDVPGDPEDYVHRVGRTARAETKGEAITLVSPDDQRKIQRIEGHLKKSLPQGEIPDELGPTPEYRPRSFNNRGDGPRRGGKGPRKDGRQQKSGNAQGGSRNNRNRSRNRRKKGGNRNPSNNSPGISNPS